MNALTIIQEYGPQALAAVGGAAGVAKGGAWVVSRIVETSREKKAARAQFEQDMRDGIRACTSGLSALSERVAVLSSQLDAHDKRTAETAALVRDAREELVEMRGELMHRIGRAENEAATARHVASEANALATNAHHRLDQHQPRRLDTVTALPFGKQKSRG